MVRNLPPEKDEFSASDYADKSKSPKELLHKEHDVYTEQKTILQKKIAKLKEKMDMLEPGDPEQAIIKADLDMEEIELDEVNKALEEIEKKVESYE